MITIKLKLENEIDVLNEQRSFNNIIHLAFNRYQDGFKEKEIRSYLKDKFSNLNCWFVQCGIKVGQQLFKKHKDKKIIFGGKYNLTRYLKKLISKDEFKDFSKDQIRNVFPDGFSDLAQIFDDYCTYYIDKYNELIDQIFDLLLYGLSDKRSEYKIHARSQSDDITKNTVFRTLDQLTAEIKTYEELKKDEYDDVISDKAEFKRLIKEIKTIEVKIFTLLKDQGLNPSDFNSLDQIKSINKMMYFFKLFLSSTGRKTKNGTALLDANRDEFGNMQLCPEIQLESDVLAKMISDFYVKKDRCAYIQIADTVFQFDEDFNPLNIPKLPIFKDAATKFNIKLLVDDNVSRISLHITAFQINEYALKGKNKLSFKKNDANWIKTKLKKIEIKTA